MLYSLLLALLALLFVGLRLFILIKSIFMIVERLFVLWLLGLIICSCARACKLVVGCKKRAL